MHLFFRPQTLSDRRFKLFSTFSGSDLSVILEAFLLLNSPPQLFYLADSLLSVFTTLSARGVVLSTDRDISPEQVN